MNEFIDKKGEEAVAKHQRLLHHKVLELVLGDMVRDEGISSVREKLLWYYFHLAEFDSEDG
jgi:hypothetical protein